MTIPAGVEVWYRAVEQAVPISRELLAPAASVSGGGSTGILDRELVVTTYRVRTAFAGASVGDTITATQVIDVSGTPSTVSTIWRNQSAAADLGAAPAAANLELVGSQALTDAQLRAAAVAITATALPLPTGAATAAAQATGNTLLTNLDGEVGALDVAAAPADGTGNYSIIAGIKRGLLNWATLLARIPALVNGRLPVNSSIPTSGSGTILALTTAATGANFTAFAAQACVALDIVNNTGVTIEYRRGGAGTAMQIPSGAARMVIGITNANQIDVRRTDASNTPVTLQAEAFVA